MSVQIKALIWAAIILCAAVVMNVMNLSNGASIGVITGLSGAAWGSLQADSGCGRGCLQ